MKLPSATRHAAIVIVCWIFAYPIADFLSEFLHNIIALLLHPGLISMAAIGLAFVDSVFNAVSTTATLGFPYGDILDEQGSSVGGANLTNTIPRINMYPYIIVVAILLYFLAFILGLHRPRKIDPI